jgi:hypothetical protein
MAWRIEEMVICGEIDNRRRGRVTGSIWLAGHPEPVQLDLRGNCGRDLAGRCLRFTNPFPRLGGLEGIGCLQAGVVGDITASRKVRVPDIAADQLEEHYQARKPIPWHWANSLYLEWFSGRSGRVVIETTVFDLEIIGEPVWDMSAEEERVQRESNRGEIAEFMKRLVAGMKCAGADEEGRLGG